MRSIKVFQGGVEGEGQWVEADGLDLDGATGIMAVASFTEGRRFPDRLLVLGDEAEAVTLLESIYATIIGVSTNPDFESSVTMARHRFGRENTNVELDELTVQEAITELSFDDSAFDEE